MSHRDDAHPRRRRGDDTPDACRQAPLRENEGTVPSVSTEARRLEWALSRADRHSVRELYFLELAVKAPDEDSANALELYAYEAYKDAEAIKEEHGLDR
jgi:hypothetical protein